MPYYRKQNLLFNCWRITVYSPRPKGNVSKNELSANQWRYRRVIIMLMIITIDSEGMIWQISSIIEILILYLTTTVNVGLCLCHHKHSPANFVKRCAKVFSFDPADGGRCRWREEKEGGTRKGAIIWSGHMYVNSMTWLDCIPAYDEDATESFNMKQRNKITNDDQFKSINPDFFCKVGVA